ncbi:MAG: hypothetical protein AB9846_10350 [Tenuifilaceae bacterium]
MEIITLKNLLKILMISLLLVFTTTCKEDDSEDFDSLDISSKLKTLEGVTVTEIPPQNGYPREFQIDITQPVDHNNPGGPKFTQRAYLSHIDETMPMISNNC